MSDKVCRLTSLHIWTNNATVPASFI